MVMHHDDIGSGPVLLMLHSGVCDRRMWAPQVAELSKELRVVTPDLRGFGDTPLPPGPFSWAADVLKLADSLEIDRVHLVGSSLGGRVALEVASLRPEFVASLGLLCPGLRGIEPTAAVIAFGEREEELLEAGDVDAAVELNVETWLGPDADESVREQVRVMQRHAFDVQLVADEQDPPPEDETPESRLNAITAPTLVVTGGRDLDHFQNIGTHVADTIKGARLVTLPWAGHLPSLERPDEVTALISGFVREHLD